MVLFGDLQEKDFNMIHAPIDHMAFGAGESLYAEGARSHGLFTLRTGMIKLVRVTTDGRQRIVRVLRPGDVAGLEALATAQYDSEAIALSDVSVCRIPLDVIHALEVNGEHLHRRLTLKWQQTLKEADNWLADLNFGTARHRLANFILMMRNPNGNQTSTLFSREDMGAMMDLKPETISREITKLVREKVIEPMDKVGRNYKVLQPSHLQPE
jgi:CRP/FNR family transcriptional regulator, anaerobic regulatory protein